jgi:hypothetical protein
MTPVEIKGNTSSVVEIKPWATTVALQPVSNASPSWIDRDRTTEYKSRF